MEPISEALPQYEQARWPELAGGIADLAMIAGRLIRPIHLPVELEATICLLKNGDPAIVHRCGFGRLVMRCWDLVVKLDEPEDTSDSELGALLTRLDALLNVRSATLRPIGDDRPEPGQAVIRLGCSRGGLMGGRFHSLTAYYDGGLLLASLHPAMIRIAEPFRPLMGYHTA